MICSDITIQSILENFRYTAECVEKGEIPERDYSLRFSEKEIDELYEAGLLNKTDTAQYEKRKLQIAEGKTRVVKAVEKGDWQCRLCDYKEVCYKDNEPREVSEILSD